MDPFALTACPRLSPTPVPGGAARKKSALRREIRPTYGGTPAFSSRARVQKCGGRGDGAQGRDLDRASYHRPPSRGARPHRTPTEAFGRRARWLSRRPDLPRAGDCPIDRWRRSEQGDLQPAQHHRGNRQEAPDRDLSEAEALGPAVPGPLFGKAEPERGGPFPPPSLGVERSLPDIWDS